MASVAVKEEATAYINEQPTYHQGKASSYVLPNNSREHVRLEQQAAHLSAIMNHQIIHAPILGTQVKRALDVGCGTGIVTKYLANKFPAAEVIGLDLTPMPDVGEATPKNINFYQGNILTQRPSEWRGGNVNLPGDNGLFDLLYSRLLVLGMNDWPGYFQKAFTLVRPGGWVEIHDIDWHWEDASDRVISDGWPWLQKLHRIMEAKGLDMRCASHAARRMEDAGFVDIAVTHYDWLMGGQPEHDPVRKAWGDYVPDMMIGMVHHMIPKVMGDSGTSAEIKAMQESMRKDFQPEPGKHCKMYVTVGRKP